MRLLFVCLGNICRSPMAEAVMRAKIAATDLAQKVTVDSAGTGNWHVGEPPHQGTQRELKKAAIPYHQIRARQISTDDFQTFDLIIAMDRQNEQDLHRLAANTNHKAKIRRFMTYLNDQPEPDVPDPYYTGCFDEVFDRINRGTDRILETLIK
ncbi:low molecular weight protein-tyrosine-phosphatase [Sporolactobacillus terrae]|uniref:protein-tyrosine-phosphatase n=1 Tax=Sporolactobacillus terrae TaxID=269673 RepID=A0A410DAX7_9BACL|nr:low molecular weight protein-tyrosine-phosphatase [Sporolactobacillus terrae]QAA23252.1 low molecular weight phosphotyrosine protein phosphatase [Sporolactobacillus terrae]QAA26222.1 low molecular weight phosphotyrosine protein phosphatase [Sporolactobacillus terrae]UAK15318.1 low molecular weight phosphotyrosine protein phosphatase [Sporolactobacillus terrae]BBN99656.1 phosphotyrosine protein phosphatase [Sporolactobacillus terrae]